MSKTRPANSMFLDYLLLTLLCLSILLPLLPTNHVYKQTVSLVFIFITVSLFIFFVRQLWSLNQNTTELFMLTLLLVFLIYLVIQITPFSIALMSQVSEQRSEIWQSRAYGLKGFATLSLDISGTIWFLILFFCYFSIFFLTSSLIVTKERLLLLILIIFSLGIYQVLFDVISKSLGYQYISASETDGHSYRLTGTFINSNNLSALINLSFAAGCALFVVLIDQFKHKKNIFDLFLLLIVILGLLTLMYGSIQSGSAGGFLALIMAVGLVGTLLLLKHLNMRRLFLFLGFFICIVSLLVFYGSRELNIEQLTNKLTLSGRPGLWAAVIHMWQDFPIFGIGAGAFEWTFPAYKTDQLSPLRIVNAHSSYLNLLVETGLIGVSLLAIIIVVYINRVIKLLKNNLSVISVIGSLMIGWLAFVIHEAVENNLLLPSVAGPFFCLMALVLCAGRIQLNKGEEN